MDDHTHSMQLVAKGPIGLSFASLLSLSHGELDEQTSWKPLLIPLKSRPGLPNM